MDQRIDPLADLSDFKIPQNDAEKPDLKVLDEISEKSGFPSRKAIKKQDNSEAEAEAKEKKAMRRYRTYRDQQINIKLSKSTLELFYKLTKAINKPQGEVFQMALSELEIKLKEE